MRDAPSGNLGKLKFTPSADNKKVSARLLRLFSQRVKEPYLKSLTRWEGSQKCFRIRQTDFVGVHRYGRDRFGG